MIYSIVWTQLSVLQFITKHFKVVTFSRANIQQGIRSVGCLNVMWKFRAHKPCLIPSFCVKGMVHPNLITSRWTLCWKLSSQDKVITETLFLLLMNLDLILLETSTTAKRTTSCKKYKWKYLGTRRKTPLQVKIAFIFSTQGKVLKYLL